MNSVGAGRLSASMLFLLAVLAGCLLAGASARAEPKLVTLDVPSKAIDPAGQNFAGPVSSTMGPHPGSLKVNVLLPNGYTPKKRYPLLLLLHGSGERYDSWADAELGDIRNTAKGLNAVIVMPEGAQGFYTDWWNDGEKGNPGWQHYLREELLPLIKRKYSIRTERRYHAVAGFSMGGYGTYLTGAQLAGYFGTVVPLSAFASIRTPESVFAFSTAAGGTPYETVYGPSTAYYAEGHDPIEWGPNFRYSNMDIYTGDGVADTTLRPENGTPTDTFSLLLESFLKIQNDQAVAAIRAAGSTTVDYTVHKGSHHFEFWRPDLEAAISKGLFNPVPEKPSNWSYRTSAPEGQAWDIGFAFSGDQTKVTEFTRSGNTLSATGDGTVNLSDGNGCQYSLTVPFTRKLTSKPCRSLKLKAKGRLKAGKKRNLTVTVTGKGDFGRTEPVDAAKVKIGGRSVTTNSRGKAVIKVKAKKKAKRLALVASKSGHKPAKKKLKVGR